MNYFQILTTLIENKIYRTRRRDTRQKKTAIKTYHMGRLYGFRFSPLKSKTTTDISVSFSLPSM